MKLDDIVEGVVHCTRKMKGGGKCNAEIPLTEENLKLMRPEVPIVTAICPVCRASNPFDKEASTMLRDQFFPDSIGQTSGESPVEAPPKDENEVTPEDFMPSVTIGAGIEKAMGLLGYKSAKWQEKIKAIKEFTRTNQLYQTPEGLQQLLFMMQIEASHVPLIVKQAFGTLTLPPDMNVCSAPGTHTAQLQGTPSGYTIHTTPQGQVIVIPPANTPPPAQAGQQVIPLSGDMEVVEERVDSKGNVVSRIIRRPSEKTKDTKETDLLTTIRTLKELGIISQPKPEDPETTKFLAAILAQMEANNQARANEQKEERAEPAPESPERRKFQESIDHLNSRFDKLEEEKKKKGELDELQKTITEQIGLVRENLRGEIQAIKSAKDERPGFQYPPERADLAARGETLRTVTSAVENMSTKLLDPVLKTLNAQVDMNKILVLRQMEQQDMVAPGTYMRAVQPAQPQTDAEVKKTVDQWKERAREATTPPPPPETPPQAEGQP
jgi:soluble cytochrome b562